MPAEHKGKHKPTPGLLGSEPHLGHGGEARLRDAVACGLRVLHRLLVPPRLSHLQRDMSVSREDASARL